MVMDLRKIDQNLEANPSTLGISRPTTKVFNPSILQQTLY